MSDRNVIESNPNATVAVEAPKSRPLRVVVLSRVSPFTEGVPEIEPECEAILRRLRQDHPDLRVEREIRRGAGSAGGRDAVNGLIARMHAGELDVLVVKRVQFLRGGNRSLWRLFDAAGDRNVRVIAADDAIDTAHGSWRTLILGLISVLHENLACRLLQRRRPNGGRRG
jgi:DNA invertase Pin-like site-specific DNA recombinase